MTLQQLQYIVAVKAHGSFSRAAEKCFVTQPTLSMQIQKLEEELGIIIFERTTKSVKATPIGEEIIQQAQVNLRGFQRIREIIEEEQNEIKGPLRIGIIPTLAPYLLPLFITGFVSKYPSVYLSVEELISEQITQKLKDDLLDVGILATPLDEKGILEIPLFYETFCAYVSTSHPLRQHDHIAAAELNIDEMLLLSEGHCFRNQVVNICPRDRPQNKLNQLRFESGSLETLKRIIELEYGYTLLPELAVRDLPPEKSKYVRELTPPLPMREVSLVVHSTVLKRNILNALQTEILEKIPESLKDKNRGKIISWR